MQNNVKATFVLMYEAMKPTSPKSEVEAQLYEFHRLRDKSNNKIQATMELATNTDGMMDDSIL